MLWLAYALTRYGKEIKKLNKFETMVRLAHFSGTQQEMTEAFGKAAVASDLMRKSADEFRSDLESLQGFVRDVQEKMSAYNAEAITQARLDEAEQPRPSNGASTHARTVQVSVHQMYANMMTEWQLFLDVFRKRLVDANIDLNLRRIGRMTYELTDKRRRNPLPSETAELIAALDAQYKRYVRMQATKGEWLTEQVHDAFVQLIQTAVRELQRSPAQSELSLGSNGLKRAEVRGNA